MFSHPDYDGHEALLFAQDTASGLRALIAIHDTTLGPAFGGCRMYPYASEQHAMTDVLRLSRGMTYKAAICELPYGGGKSVMIADQHFIRAVFQKSSNREMCSCVEVAVESSA